MAPSEPQTPLQRAKALLLRALAARAHSEAELRRKLSRKELSEVADEAIAWLKALGYLDDGAFASGRAKALLRSGRVGPRMAEQKLAVAGIARGAAKAAVVEALEAEGGSRSRGELALCRALAARRAGVDPAKLDDRARARLGRFLLGRGFSGEVVNRVLGAGFDLD